MLFFFLESSLFVHGCRHFAANVLPQKKGSENFHPHPTPTTFWWRVYLCLDPWMYRLNPEKPPTHPLLLSSHLRGLIAAWQHAVVGEKRVSRTCCNNNTLRFSSPPLQKNKNKKQKKRQFPQNPRVLFRGTRVSSERAFWTLSWTCVWEWWWTPHWSKAEQDTVGRPWDTVSSSGAAACPPVAWSPAPHWGTNTEMQHLPPCVLKSHLGNLRNRGPLRPVKQPEKIILTVIKSYSGCIHDHFRSVFRVISMKTKILWAFKDILSSNAFVQVKITFLDMFHHKCVPPMRSGTKTLTYAPTSVTL